MKSWPQREYTRCLDGFWDFAWLADSVALENFKPSMVKKYAGKNAVPGVFDMGIDHYCQHGLGVYRTFVSVPEGRNKLEIGGMGLAGRIFWDGKEIGRSGCAYQIDRFDLPESDDFFTKHELVIAVDNRVEAQSYQFFREEYDFYAFGGIYRSVNIYPVLPYDEEGSCDCMLERIQVITRNIRTGEVQLRLIFSGNVPEKVSFDLWFDDAEDKFRSFTRKTQNGVVNLNVNVPDFKVWSPESPNLHTVSVAFGEQGVAERFGIRTVEAKNYAIYLNGEKISLRGANRHETHPQFGPVQSYQTLVDDIRLFKEAGMNFIRAVHYPPDQAFLDLCDETGMLVWVESLGWGLNDPADHSEKTLPLFMAQNRRMIRDGFNHPSVIIWAMLNECASHLETSKDFFRELLLDMKKEDPSRLRSFASCRNIYDVCLDEVDVISMNCYPGWFQDITDSHTLASDLIEPHIKALGEFYSRPEFSGKPLLVSEIGACGMYGVHDRNLAQWSEEFQADFMRESVRAILDNKNWCGFALWQFCDSRSYQRGQVRGKPRGFNLAGLVDEYRRPKMAYDAVKELLQSGNGKGKKK